MPVIDWTQYDCSAFHDELISTAGVPRDAANLICQYLGSMDQAELTQRQLDAERSILEMGVTFTVYSEGQNIDRAWPFDIMPRTIDATEWERIERGLVQRLTALNAFIDDLYRDQRIIADKIVPEDLISSSVGFLKACIGASPPHGVWANICGSDLVRDSDGQMFVLEDNLRVPSGVSYMIENRHITKHVFPELFQDNSIVPVEDYPSNLFDMLSSLVPKHADNPRIVVLTPGIYNSAYFEHSYLAQKMGVDLVEGGDLIVDASDRVFVKTVNGLERVDVIYRRINDTFLDPECFEPTSLLGVAGLMRAWRAGHVALANAPGAGVADDKVVYTYVPEMIRYYLDSDPILPNVPTWLCQDEKSRSHVLANLDKLVVKPANESGGYGMLVGPKSTKSQQEQMAQLIKSNPRNYIAQPTLTLSTAPTLTHGHLEPRHLDLRPFILQGAESYVTPGGLTRVALTKGSLVVNSSQGGGSKDTWVITASV
jgi:uncharacterized circularly permuted ATP-grasp superfamily protein